ncbi:lactadherin-like [Amphiura filiformis]|uniref:lactadherin-like n=1 Tax=Amphiura filiformis TaxID=82378 RepID=UPI003B21C419
MENGGIADNKITASSYEGNERLPQYGRLHHDKAWTSQSTDNASWIQVDLGQEMKIIGILTQGLQTMAHEYCVEEFRVKTGVSETLLSYVQDNDGIGEKVLCMPLFLGGGL